MKKIISILCFLFVANYAFAQVYPTPYQQLGRLNIAVQNAGGMLVTQTLVVPQYSDTTAANSEGKPSLYSGSLIFTTSDNLFWTRNATATKWLIFFNATNGSDTLFAQLPAFFDSTTHPGATILKILHANGLVSGGMVTLDSCFSVDVAPGIGSLNYNQVSFAQVIRLAIATANVFDRTDAVIADSFGVVSILKGAAGNIAPYIDPSSMILLATIPVPANATCLSITPEIIYDQNTGSPEWTLTTFGTITAAPSNTDNPFHLTRAYFVSKYTDSSALIFTKPSGNDTVHAGEILKFFLYSNGVFNNQIIGQYYLNSTPASSRIVLNPYLNVNDSNQYQIVAPPLSAWSWPGGNIFNKFVLSFTGYDTTGGKGLYIDWMQLQTGIVNVNNGSGGGLNIYNGDSALSSNRTVDLNGKEIQFVQGGNQFLYLDPAVNEEVASIGVTNITGGTNVAAEANYTTDTSALFNFAAIFNGGEKIAGISALVQSGISSITHTADTHTFNGTSEFISSTIDPGSSDNVIYDALPAYLTIQSVHHVTDSTTASSSYTMADSTFTMDAYYNSRHDNAFRHQLIATPSYIQIVRGDVGSSVPLNLPPRFVIRPDSLSVNVNSVSFFQGDTLKKGHLDLTTLPYAAKTSTYPITAADYTINATSGTFTTTLPTAVGIAGKIYVITNSGTGVVTVATTSSQTFANVVATPTTLTLNQFSTATVQSNGANWLRLTNL